MIGLIKKDLYVLSHAYYKNILFTIFLYMVMALFSAKMSFVLFFLGWISGFYIINSLSIDNYSKWDLYANSLPLKKSQIVGAKFLLLLLSLAAFSLLACVLYSFTSLFHSITFDENIVSALVILPIYLVFFGITLALSYKIGPEKARTFTTILLAAFGAFILFVSQSDFIKLFPVQAFLFSDFPPVSFYLIEYTITMVLYALCWYTATVIYKHKDF